MSDFAGLQIALTSLYAQRRGLEVTGHNISNANTEGYSRQRVDMVNIGAPLKPAFWSRYVGDGGGVQVDDVIRFRDAFLEVRAALEHGAQGELTQAKAVLDRLETLFAEPGDVGLQNQFTEFWAGWDDVANNPSDPASRQQLLERANTLAVGFNEAAAAISQLRTDTITELRTVIDEVNTSAATLAQLNESIKNMTIAGLSANDLMDQRDLLANKIAEQTGATIRNTEYGQIDVSIAGTQLVTGNRAQTLSLDTSAPTAAIRWVKDNFAATVTTGTAGGKLDAINTTLPGYLADLNTIALQLRDDVNELHSGITGEIAAADQDLSAAGNLTFQVKLNSGSFTTVTVAGADWSGAGGAAALQTALQTAIDTAVGAGNATATVTGGAGSPLAVSLAGTGTNTLQVQANGTNAGFATLLGTTAVGSDGIGGRRMFEGTSAADLAVSVDIVGNGAAIAAGVAEGGPLDGSRALELAELTSSATGADSLYRSFIVAMGVDAQTTNRRFDVQMEATARVDAARDSNSGVNVDEEMVNMVQYQHAYEAAARFMTAIDQMLDTLVNGTGVVGR